MQLFERPRKLLAIPKRIRSIAQVAIALASTGLAGYQGKGMQRSWGSLSSTQTDVIG